MKIIRILHAIFATYICYMMFLNVMIEPKPAYASGYHPDLDQAINEAELIVTGKIIKEWAPRNIQSGEKDWFAFGKVYQLKIDYVFKGNVEVNQEVEIRDHPTSTASYFLEKGEHVLIYLNPFDSTGWVENVKQFDFDTDRLYEPIRRLSLTTNEGTYSSSFQDETSLLRLVLAEPPINLIAPFRKIIKDHVSDEEVCAFVIKHWPHPMEPGDVELLRDFIDRRLNDWMVAGDAIERLHREGERIPNELLITYLKKADPYIREKMLLMIDADNIEAVKEIIYPWLFPDDSPGADDYVYAEGDIIYRLVKYAPGYLQERIAKSNLSQMRLHELKEGIKNAEHCIECEKNGIGCEEK